MKKFAFVSRHTPTPEQVELANAQRIELISVGDADAFTITPRDYVGFDGVIVVHPAAALNLCPHYIIGIFENEMRAEEGKAPVFHAKALHIWDSKITCTA